MDDPKITIITPSYNQGEFLEDTIKSVLEQDYSNLEYFIFDGGSTDNSVEIIRKYEKHLDFWVSEKDNGQTDAINKGMKKATGEIVAWLNSDDFYYPGTLQTIADAYATHPEAGLFVGNGTLNDKSGRKIRTYSDGVGFDFDVLLKGSNFILQPSTFINRKVFSDVGYLDETLYYTMDLEFWLRVGEKYPVVTIDKELSAYRWYEDIKTSAGGFKRWVEQWQVIRRYTDEPITHGLLVEFFNVLQETEVQDSLAIEGLGQIAQQSWQAFYEIMQKKLNTRDCIPIQGSDIRFAPEKEETATEASTPVAPNIVSCIGSTPKVDVVLPMGHSWFVRGGYVQALRHFGSLGREFQVSEGESNQGLFDYLKNPKCDLLFLMNTDWHAPYLHNSREWRQRWRENNVTKLLFSFESMNNPVIRQSEKWYADTMNAVNFAMECVDGVVFAHEIDEELFGKFGKPIIWQPFAIDEEIFPEPKEYLKRKNRAFFRGKATPFYHEVTYDTRRHLMERLHRQPNIDIYDGYNFDDYNETGTKTLEKNQKFIHEMNEFQVTLALPSLSPTMVVRPFEAMASGCVVFQNQVQGKKSQQLFGDGKHLIMYDAQDAEGFIEKIDHILKNPEKGRQIAQNGYEEVLEKHTIKHRVLDVLNWVNETKWQVAPASPAPKRLSVSTSAKKSFVEKIIIDGIIFYLQKEQPAGISRVWTALLQELAKTDLAKQIVLLDRGGTAPDIPGVRKRQIHDYNYLLFEADSLYLEDICREEQADLFISTYHTYPENTHCVIMLHDMIPELRGMDLSLPEWRAKTIALERAKAYFSVSESTKNDFRKLFPQFRDRQIYVVPNAVASMFTTHKESDIEKFKTKYNLKKPYFVLSGNRLLYKNAIQFFKAFALLENREQFEIFCTGGAVNLENVFKPYVRGVTCHVHFLSDEELSLAYAGAVALVYPSLHEGFGLPILEAMQSGCPVITCKNSSIPEVAGEAALYVKESDVADMLAALQLVQQPGNRKQLIEKGLTNVARFSWRDSARKIVVAIQDIVQIVGGMPFNEDDPIYTEKRLFYVLKKQQGNSPLVTAMANHLKVFTGPEMYDHKKIEQDENIIARMDSSTFELMRNEFYGQMEANAVFCYWFGLALHFRKQYNEALDAFIKAFERKVGYRWRIAYLAAVSAYDAHNLVAAEHLLKEIVLKDFPNYKPALDKLKAVMKEKAQGPQTSVRGKKKRTKTRVERSDFHTDESAEPLVSAIVSTYNSERFIRGCLEDLEAQSIAQHLEIIVVDSASKQNEKKIVRDFQQRYSNIKYIRSKKREGVYTAWNRGIKLARGKYITNANTDDRHRHDAFEKMINILEKNPEVALVYANVYITKTENETFENHTRTGSFRWYDFDFIRLIDGCYMGPQPMWRRNLHKKYGYFDEQYRSAGDWEFWLRIGQTESFYHLDEYLGLYLQSPDSVEHRNPQLSIREARTIQKQYLPFKQKFIKRQFERAEKHLRKDELVEGLELLSGILDYEPDHFDTLCVLGDLYQRLGEESKAVQMWSLALKQKPQEAELLQRLRKPREKNDRIETLFEQGKALIQKNDLSGGLKVLSELLDIDPTHKETLQLMSQVFEKIGKHDDAVAMRKLI